jgi:hypothetical protein
MTNEQKIVQIFMENVHGKQANTVGMNLIHDGSNGHWL